LVRQLELPAEISRSAPSPTLLPFTRFFKGFERNEAVKKMFGDETNEVIRNLSVEFCTNPFGFMAVSHKDGHLIVSRWHLKNSDHRTLYLDLIHELFHVGQFRHNRESFIKGYEVLVRNPFAYFKNPIEIAAYRYTVEEAKRIGLTQSELKEYLSVPWAAPDTFRTFLREVDALEQKRNDAKPAEVRVQISRKAPIKLYPFTDYFEGFEKVAGVKKLFGDNTEKILRKLRVEFSSHPLDYVRMIPEDGHLEISLWHLSYSDISMLYLDLFLYLQYASQFLAGRWETYSGYGVMFPALVEAISKEDPEFRDYYVRSSGFDGLDAALEATKMDGFGATDMPLMIEAYRATVNEGRRIGMSEEELADYVYAPAGPMTKESHERFMRNLGIRQTGKRRRVR
jgi:hypothetical protein